MQSCKEHFIFLIKILYYAIVFAMETSPTKLIKYLVVICILILMSFCIIISRIQNSYQLIETIEKTTKITPKQNLNSTKKVYSKEELQKTKDYLLGKFEPKDREDFVSIPKKYNISGYKMYLRKEALNAFLQMAKDAEKSNVELRIVSATRNFNYQKNLWNNKWDGTTLVDNKDLSKTITDESERFDKILEYSAAPGTSRHHFGTDIDINGVSPTYIDTKEGEQEYEWLTQNAALYGFCQPYNKKNTGTINDRINGYNEEKWHWSYIPLAKSFTQEYKNLIKDEDIKGFLGDEYVKDHDLINNYVLSINPECL